MKKLINRRTAISAISALCVIMAAAICGCGSRGAADNSNTGIASSVSPEELNESERESLAESLGEEVDKGLAELEESMSRFDVKSFWHEDDYVEYYYFDGHLHSYKSSDSDTSFFWDQDPELIWLCFASYEQVYINRDNDEMITGIEVDDFDGTVTVLTPEYKNGRLNKIKKDGSTVIEYEYDDNGRVTEVTRVNNTINYSYLYEDDETDPAFILLYGDTIGNYITRVMYDDETVTFTMAGEGDARDVFIETMKDSMVRFKVGDNTTAYYARTSD